MVGANTLTIGSSEIATVLGVGRTRDSGEPYTSPVALWGRITGILPRYDTGPASPDAELGRWYEPAVLMRYASEVGLQPGQLAPGPTLEQIPFTAPGVPFHARWDAYNLRDNRPVEAKCPRELDEQRWGPTGTDDVPPEYACQVIGQMAVAHALFGADSGDLGAMARAPGWGNTRTWCLYHVRRDAQREQRVMDAVLRWLDTYVAQEVCPPPDGSDDASRALRRMWAPVDDKVLVADADTVATYHRALRSRAAIRELRDAHQELEQALQIRMTDHTALRATEDGDDLIRWRVSPKDQKRRFYLRGSIDGE